MNRRVRDGSMELAAAKRLFASQYQLPEYSPVLSAQGAARIAEACRANPYIRPEVMREGLKAVAAFVEQAVSREVTKACRSALAGKPKPGLSGLAKALVARVGVV